MGLWDVIWLAFIVREMCGSWLDKVLIWTYLVTDALGLWG